jgi:hypothetical protein
MSLMEPSRSSSNIFYACRGHVETVRACGCYKNSVGDAYEPYLGLEMGRAGSGFALNATQLGGSGLAQRCNPAQPVSPPG